MLGRIKTLLVEEEPIKELSFAEMGPQGSAICMFSVPFKFLETIFPPASCIYYVSTAYAIRIRLSEKYNLKESTPCCCCTVPLCCAGYTYILLIIVFLMINMI